MAIIVYRDTYMYHKLPITGLRIASFVVCRRTFIVVVTQTSYSLHAASTTTHTQTSNQAEWCFVSVYLIKHKRRTIHCDSSIQSEYTYYRSYFEFKFIYLFIIKFFFFINFLL